MKITFPACAAVDMSQARLKEEGVRAVQSLADVVTRPMGPCLLALVGPWLVALLGACLVVAPCNLEVTWSHLTCCTVCCSILKS